jgi:heterotetrameric sarcosine oxidase delta subunit
VTLEIACPNCGARPHTEFAFGGEDRPHAAPDPAAEFERVFYPANVEGAQRERWYHALGCRSWFVLTRHTRTNRIG